MLSILKKKDTYLVCYQYQAHKVNGFGDIEIKCNKFNSNLIGELRDGLKKHLEDKYQIKDASVVILNIIEL